jgi:predicted phage terminase large subunit-like protein
MQPLTPAQIEALLKALPTLPPKEQEALLKDLDDLADKKGLQGARDDFLLFCHRVYPGFKEGPHHRFLRPILHRVLEGTEPRVTVSMPPRFGKSETISYLFVAWYLGHNPTHHIIMVTHTADLSAGFGRKIRDLIDSPVYSEIFPDTVVAKDKAAAGNWLTTTNGKYLAIGIGANVAGHGAHLLIADDLVSENAMMANPDATFDNAWQYMQIGPLQRLMPNGKIVMIGTRWGKRDPIGRALLWAQDNPVSPQWLEVRFPAILPSGKSLWSEQWPIEQLQAKKASMLPQFWSAQYQQEPTSEEGALIKREWWKVWEKDEPPEVQFIISAWDTAHEAKTRADYSACTTWGVWETEDKESRIILLDAIKGQWEFPELKAKALEHWKQWEPDSLIVEKKAAGAPLIQEMRRMNIVVTEVSPSRGRVGVSNDKYARMNAISDIFKSGLVYYPDKRWAHEVVDNVAEFPFGLHDDYADTVQMTMERYRSGGFLRLPSDLDDNVEDFRSRQKAYYG